MKISSDQTTSRRSFLRFLAGSPLLASLGLPAWLAGKLEASTGRGQFHERKPGRARKPDEVIGSPADAINVFDFEAAARNNLPPAHWGYLATGVDDDATLHANREGFKKFQIRPRRLVDVTKVDTSTEVLGTKMETPIVIAPAGSQKAFHAEGEVAVARAAKAKGHLQILSTVTTSSVEEVTAARGEPIWYQLYATSGWDVTKGLLKRAEAAGCPVVVLTVDLPVGSNRETLRRFQQMDERECSVCHEPGDEGYFRRRPMFHGLDIAGRDALRAPGLTWEFLRRLRDETKMKLVVKGIVTHEDASLCLKHGVDGIIVSNHGGRAEESNRSTIECLPEIVEAVGRKIPVLIDSGFRRGTDIFKALALGARAICIGRPYLWGLAAFGQEGVEAVLAILRGELELAMQLAGTRSLSEITPSFVQRA